MELGEFYELKRELEIEQQLAFEQGDPAQGGLLMVYRNNKGEQREFFVKNIDASPLYGCFEADCYSDYQAGVQEVTGICDPYEKYSGVTSHRTFKIANIISARIDWR